MRPSTQEEINEYEERIKALQDKPLTEEHIQACLKRVRELCKAGTDSDFIKFEQYLREQQGKHFLYYSTSRLSELSVLDPHHHKLENDADDMFRWLYNDGDYLFYYSNHTGMAGRWGPVLICGKTLLCKHYHWDMLS